ncbi:MAG: 50S ribosomal protein L29 [Alphaproteobacteria bacterium]|nr:50S ribosomal protein L29 [Alphaproteobacteria bacterium]
MKAIELRNKQPDELKKQLEDLREESLNLRFQAAAGQLANTVKRREVRRSIAQVKTVLHEKS